MSHQTRPSAPPGPISKVRTALVVLLIVAGIAWLVVFRLKGDTAEGISWMFDLDRWNYLIGFGLIFAGLILGAHKDTPLGRGRGVVISMLACFLIGLAWIVLYYFTANQTTFPVFSALGQYNLVVGISFMATGFVYATKWE